MSGHFHHQLLTVRRGNEKKGDVNTSEMVCVDDVGERLEGGSQERRLRIQCCRQPIHPKSVLHRTGSLAVGE
jgi:hypothetical protein